MKWRPKTLTTYNVKIVGQIVNSYYIDTENQDEAIEIAKERFESDFYVQHLSANRFPDEAEWELIEAIKCEEGIPWRNGK
jgi:transcription elongation factor GreA-like protein